MTYEGVMTDPMFRAVLHALETTQRASFLDLHACLERLRDAHLGEDDLVDVALRSFTGSAR